jgi:hypothetical protein
VLSHADAPEVLSEKVKPVKGEVRVFTSLADPTYLKPTLVVKTNTDTNIIQVLKQMRKKYLPIESKFSATFVDHFTQSHTFSSESQNLCAGEW